MILPSLVKRSRTGVQRFSPVQATVVALVTVADSGRAITPSCRWLGRP